jgi:hypothetical protein
MSAPNKQRGGPGESCLAPTDTRWEPRAQSDPNIKGEPRWKRSRRRRKAGRAKFYIEANVSDLADFLHDESFLDDWREKDLTKIEAALQECVDALLRVASWDAPEW